MAWRMLMRRCPSRSMTVVGDLAQTGAPWGAGSWAEVLDPHAARPLAPGAAHRQLPHPGRDHGGRRRRCSPAPTRGWRPPTLDARDRDGAVAPAASARPSWPHGCPRSSPPRPAEVGGGRLAVLVPTAQAERARPADRRRPAGGWPSPSGPAALDALVAVLTVTETKGLEFDGVVVVEPAAILAESPNGREQPVRRAHPGHPAPRRRPHHRPAGGPGPARAAAG